MKPQKSSLLNGRAIRGGGGLVKGRPLMKKNFFTLDNLSKYGHITLKFVGRYFSGLLKYFPKYRAKFFLRLPFISNTFFLQILLASY